MTKPTKTNDPAIRKLFLSKENIRKILAGHMTLAEAVDAPTSPKD